MASAALKFTLTPEPAPWFVKRLERLFNALDAEEYRAPLNSDGDVEYHGQLAAAKEAAEALDIALSNLGWLATFHGSLDGDR